MFAEIDPDQFIPASVVAEPVGVEYTENGETVVDGNMPRRDLSIVCRMVAHLRPRTVFEIGTYLGGTTQNIARLTPDDTLIYTLDLGTSLVETAHPLHPWERRYAEKPEVGLMYRQAPEARKIVQLLGDSAKFDFGRYSGLIDFILVDASHTYENCMSDSLRAITMRSPRGVIVWHDYSVWGGVTAALDDLQRCSERFKPLRHVKGTAIAVLLQ